MIDPKNIINITGGVVADPELVNDGKIANFTLAVDYAGSEKGSDNNTGYFDIVYWTLLVICQKLDIYLATDH